jgi:hypothetical protein
MTIIHAIFARLRAVTVLAGALAFFGCASTPTLKPTSDAQTVPGTPLAAVTENSGVRMTVEPEAWSANPSNLDQRMLPLKVTIVNQGDKPVRVRYDDFTLEAGAREGGEGARYKPLPPVDIRGSVTERADRPVTVRRPPISPLFVSHGFLIAPWYAPYYLGMSPLSHGWAYSPYYYDTYYPRWTVHLPSEAMLRLAIPEGVVQPGGSVKGFLYFPRIEGKPDRVTFKAELMDGDDGTRLGALELPFEIG